MYNFWLIRLSWLSDLGGKVVCKPRRLETSGNTMVQSLGPVASMKTTGNIQKTPKRTASVGPTTTPTQANHHQSLSFAQAPPPHRFPMRKHRAPAKPSSSLLGRSAFPVFDPGSSSAPHLVTKASTAPLPCASQKHRPPPARARTPAPAPEAPRRQVGGTKGTPTVPGAVPHPVQV